MKPVAIGIVGYGKIAHDQHVPAIAATQGVELVAIADPLAPVDGVSAYPDLEQMLAAHPEIDAVSICTPPPVRGQLACEALHGRKHVLLEKPACSTLVEAWEVTAMAEKVGVTLFTAWHSKFGAAVPSARVWLAGKAIRSVRVTWKEDVRVWHPGQDWIWQDGGFGVFDPGINALSIISEILPLDLKLVDAELSVPENCRTPIAARLSLAANRSIPITAEFDFRQTGPQSWDIEIEADEGRLRLSSGGNRLEIDGIEQQLDAESEYRQIYERFHSLIQAGKSEVDLVPLRIVDDALASGRIIPVEPFEE